MKLGSMLFILELKGGKTEKNTPILIDFFEFIKSKRLYKFFDKEWISKAKYLKNLRNLSSHSSIFGKKKAEELLNETIELLNFYEL